MKKTILALLLFVSATVSHAFVIITVDIDADTITLTSSDGGLDWNFTGANYRFGVSNGGATSNFYSISSLAASPSSDTITPLAGNSALIANSSNEITLIEFRGQSPNPQNGWDGTLTMTFNDLSALTFSSDSWSTTHGVANGGLTVSAVPEPANYAAFAGLGMLALTLCRRRRMGAGKSRV